MATRSARDNKALNVRHAETLKAMLRRPENKVCADCKRNDPRWASTNLGCFMCIRCSGIHRSMGVHITRIKSIDLDTWTPEQVANVQRWGNKRANAFWEAHLKPGHMPPDHKIESFIRSKYESKRWARQGPIPEPESLDSGDEEPLQPAAIPATSSVSTNNSHDKRPSTTLGKSSVAPPLTSSINLLDGPPASGTQNAVNPTTKQGSATQPSNGGGLFDLDFSPAASSAAATATAPAARKDVKNDILSLFSAKPQGFGNVSQSAGQAGSIQAMGNQFGGMNLGVGGAATTQVSMGHDPWGAFGGASNNSTLMSGQTPGSFGLGAGGTATAKQADALGGAADPWGSVTATNTAQSDPFGSFASAGASSTNKKTQDAFSDIWN